MFLSVTTSSDYCYLLRAESGVGYGSSQWTAQNVHKVRTEQKKQVFSLSLYLITYLSFPSAPTYYC